MNMRNVGEMREYDFETALAEAKLTGAIIDYVLALLERDGVAIPEDHSKLPMEFAFAGALGAVRKTVDDYKKREVANEAKS